MATKDQVTTFTGLLSLSALITTDTTTNGAIIDTAEYDLGNSFLMHIGLYTDGTYTMQIQESDDSGMSGATLVSGDQIIGTLPVLSAVTASGGVIAEVGVISNKRFLRAQIVSTSTSTGASVHVDFIGGNEYKP